MTVCIRSLSRLCSIVSEAGEDASDLAECLSNLHNLSGVLNELFELWEQYEETLESVAYGGHVSYSVAVEQTSRRGRPRFLVSADQLEHLRALSFSWTYISSLLGVSRMTVYRRRAECGLVEEQRDVLSDTELDGVISNLRRDMPYSGQTVIMGYLRSMGYYATRIRVRESIRRTDPLNTPQRWGGDMHQRRPYSVPGPNSLWHLGKLTEEHCATITA